MGKTYDDLQAEYERADAEQVSNLWRFLGRMQGRVGDDNRAREIVAEIDRLREEKARLLSEQQVALTAKREQLLARLAATGDEEQAGVDRFDEDIARAEYEAACAAGEAQAAAEAEAYAEYEATR